MPTLKEALKEERSRGSQLERLLLLQIKAEKLPTPEREYRFDPVRKWRFDMAWPSFKIAVEVEGGTWINGAHTRGAHFASDCMKYNSAVLAGWRVLRFDNKMVESGLAVDVTRKLLHQPIPGL